MEENKINSNSQGEEQTLNQADNTLSVFQTDIVGNYSTLLQAQEEREQLAKTIVLDATKEGVEDKSREINKAADTKHPDSAVSIIVQSEIVRVAAGMLKVPEYHPRANAEQKVWLFCDTHWKTLDTQEYFDFINDCCKKIGLPEKYLGNFTYMEKIYQGVAFQLSRSDKKYVPSDQARINFKNGTLIIKADGTKEFYVHKPEDNFTYCLPYAYDTTAECPLWHKFLDQMLPENEAQTILAEYIAYGFIKGIRTEKMLVLQGRGANGKSVVLDVITSLVGRQNISNVSLDSLTNDDIKRAMIENRMFNISHESNGDLDVSVLKLLVSGEPVDSRVLYVGPRTIYNYAKLITSFNVLPRPENTHGFYRRFCILPFNVTISEEEKDTDLSKKLCEELPGILNWVLSTIPDFIARRNFTKSPLSEEALKKYRLSSDTALLFVTTCCEIGNGTDSGKNLYDSYKRFCINEEVKSLGKQNFFTRLEDVGGVIREMHNNMPHFNLKVVDYESCRY